MGGLTDAAKPLVIFDLDGTLIDSAPDIHAGVLDTLASEDLEPITFAQTRSFIGKGVPALMDQVRAALGLHEDADQKARMVAHFTKLYETSVGETVLYPGVIEALDALQAQGFELALCTNKPELPTYAVIDHFDMRARFVAWAFGDGPYKRKPDPAPVQHVMSQAGAASAIYVGDSETDAATAKAAGLPFLLFTEGYRKTPVEDLLHHAAFSDFAELPALVGELS